MVIVGFASAVTGAYGPMLSPGFVEIAASLHVTVGQLAQATAWLVLTAGLGLFVLNPLAKVYGKRPIYLFSIIVLFISAILGGRAENYSSLLSSRILGGIGGGPFEILIQCTVGDLYFVHERATRIAFWNLCLLAGVSAGSLISGYIIDGPGWKWCFWVCAIMYGILTFLIFFFVPETSYKRANTAIVQPESPKACQEVDEKVDDVMHLDKINALQPADAFTSTDPPNSIPPAKLSKWQSLRLYTGRHSNAPLWRIFIRPFVLFFYPAVLATLLIYGIMISWYVVFGIICGITFVVPPYNFTVGQVGLINLSPLVFSIAGEIISGPLNDAICLYLTRKNKGIYEPEFRLVLMIAVAITGPVGFYAFGLSIHYQSHWSGPVISYGICSFALAVSSTSLFGYVLDSYPTLNEEAFVAINARDLLGFGLTYIIDSWLKKDGVLNVFIVFGSLTLFACLMTIPLWVYGKQWRSWIAKNSLLQSLTRD